MGIGKPVVTIAWQRVFIFRRGIRAVEPSLVPVLRMTVQLGMRKFKFFPLLDGDATKFSVGTVYKFCAPVQMKKNPETAQQLVLLVSTLHRRLGSCIDWTPNWVRYLEDGIGNYQAHLRKTSTRRFESTAYVVNKDHHLTLPRGRRILCS